MKVINSLCPHEAQVTAFLELGPEGQLNIDTAGLSGDWLESEAR